MFSVSLRALIFSFAPLPYAGTRSSVLRNLMSINFLDYVTNAFKIRVTHGVDLQCKDVVRFWHPL